MTITSTTRSTERADLLSTLATHRGFLRETVRGLTDEQARALPDLDAAHPLPQAPWWPEGGRWSARRTLLHVVAETTQHAGHAGHAGHADIIREALDGQKTMG